MNEHEQHNPFDTASTNWDKPRRVELANTIRDSILSHINPEPNWQMADFGCGTGLLSLPMADRVKNLTGIDTSSGMLEEMERKARDRGILNLFTLNCDLLDESCDPGPFDLLISSMTLHHVRDLTALVQKLHSILVPGGLCAVADLTPEDGSFHGDNSSVAHLGLDPEELSERMRNAGFTDVMYRTIHHIEREREGKIIRYPVFLLTAKRSR
jgi:2-polyprenyl-3-methyl-5-hydroxy-6-metoxy-1,4-benzoquinol methylase